VQAGLVIASLSALSLTIAAVALAGSRTVRSIAICTWAFHPDSVIFSTLPTVTSLTLTAACGTRSSTSPNSAVIW